MENIEVTTKFFKLRDISSINRIDGNYSFTLVIYLFSSVSLQLQRKYIIFYCEENVHWNWIGWKCEFLKAYPKSRTGDRGILVDSRSETRDPPHRWNPGSDTRDRKDETQDPRPEIRKDSTANNNDRCFPILILNFNFT